MDLENQVSSTQEGGSRWLVLHPLDFMSLRIGLNEMKFLAPGK